MSKWSNKICLQLTSPVKGITFSLHIFQVSDQLPPISPESDIKLVHFNATGKILYLERGRRGTVDLILISLWY